LSVINYSTVISGIETGRQLRSPTQ